MEITVLKNPKELGKAAAKAAGQLIRETIARSGNAHIILATGTSQLETLEQLVKEHDIEWNRVVMFHLDEYIGLSEFSPASFRKYLKERFLDLIPPLKAVYLVDGQNNPQEECERLNKIIAKHPIDVALVGIGENCHLAFNDPPADFETENPYIVVALDDGCRKQQHAEGWFHSISDVPKQAISMSIKQICKSKHIICSVPDSRKARAVKDCLERPVANLYPASILQQHPDCYCFLDMHSAALLSVDTAL